MIPADPRLGPDLLWRDIRAPRFESPRPALFVDRDGVLIAEKFYLADPAEVEILPGALQLLYACRDRRIPVIEVTNQSGIARGKFGWPEFASVEAQLVREGLTVDAVFACPFHSSGQGVYRDPDHPWRKPDPGMLLEAARVLNLDLSRSLMIGDKASDTGAAKSAGLPAAIQVLTGHGQEQVEKSRALQSPGFDVRIVPSVAEALEQVLTWLALIDPAVDSK